MAAYRDIKIDNRVGLLTNIHKFDKFVSVDGGLDRESVIMLSGTSGSGKSSMCKLIQKNMPDVKTALLQRETSANAMAKQLKRIVIEHKNAFVEDNMTVQEFLIFAKENG